MEAVMESQAQLQLLFLQKMETFQAELKKVPSIDGSATLAEDFNSFRAFILTALKGLQDQISLLARESDSQEMRARRKILLIHGLTEEKSEDTVAIVVRAVVQQMKVTEFTATDVSRCHRMGRSSSPDKPRPILVKIHDLALRNKIWYAKTALKGSGITLSEFLTKPRHDTFMAARQRFGVKNSWTRDGFVFVLGLDGSRHRVSGLAELSRIKAPAPLGPKPVSVSKSPKPVAAREPSVKEAARTTRRAATTSKK